MRGRACGRVLTAQNSLTPSDRAAVMSASITQKEVFTAIVSLLGEGKNPHHLNVRKALGGRGSGPHLSRFIRAFYAQYGRTMVHPPKVHPPKRRVEESFDQLLTSLRTAKRPEPHEGTAAYLTAVFECIGTNLDQIFVALMNWESELNCREERLSHLEPKLRNKKSAAPLTK